MKRPTMANAEEAARLLGIDVYDIAWLLRQASADELDRLASRIRREEDEPLDVGRARRLKWAAEAAQAAWDSVLAAATEEKT